MKYLIILFFILSISLYSQNKIQGTILDATTKQPLPNANVVLQNQPQTGTSSDSQGRFSIEGSFSDEVNIVISYVGYEDRILKAAEFRSESGTAIYLNPMIIPSQSVLVKASIGTSGITPLAFEKINRQAVEENYTVQDIPQFLSSMPSTTFYSENGNGIGYNYISIRGFDQRRISVSINGIPQNDPEDQNVYWLDFPDLLASTEMIQVQRGAGSGVFGYPAIGGSINIITSTFSNKPQVNLGAYMGSYNTRKYVASFSSGLIGNKYSVYAKLSRILSDGYRDLSGVRFDSYHISAVRYDKNLTTQINFYGGPIRDNLAYTGLAKFAVKDKNLRKANYSYWESAGNEYTYTLPRRNSEIENFSQPHYELLNELKLSDDIILNSGLFLVTGTGFFDYDASWADTSYFRLTHDNGFDAAENPVNSLIRAQVENTQYGWIPRISIKHDNGEFFAGAELRKHKSLHWGKINYGEQLPEGTEDYRYYSYNGSKDIISAFVHESYSVTDDLNILAELQLAYHKYRLYDEKFVVYDFSVNGVFLNPRAGINYKFSNNHNIFISFARVTKEPRLKNYYDAAESSGGAEPQFNKNQDGLYDFNSPLVEPETMNDVEVGTSIMGAGYQATLNLFYMLFEDEIVKNGELDRFGQPVTGNIDNTLHTGIEFNGNVKFADYFNLFANASVSKNIIRKGNYYIDSVNFIDLSDNRISGFPDFLANMGLSFKTEHIYLQLSAKYVGSFYSDNYDEKLGLYLERFPGLVDYSDNKNEAYFIADFTGAYEMNPFNSLSPSKIILQVNNLFDQLYSANAIGKEFFPAAERNFLVGIQLGL